MLETEAASEQSATVKLLPATKSLPSRNTSRKPKASSRDVLCSSKTSTSPKNKIGNYYKKYFINNKITS